jgi:hypothetical protein
VTTATATPSPRPTLSSVLTQFDKPTAPKLPAAWKAGVEFNGHKGMGTITSRPVLQGADVDWDDVMASFGIDAGRFGIDPDSLRFHAKEQQTKNGPQTFVVWKADLNKKVSELGWDKVDGEIANAAKRAKVRTAAKVGTLERSIVLGLGDWQMGNGEGGGSEKIVERVATAIDGVADMLKAEKKSGRTPETLVLAGLGDIVESCSGFYAMQTFQVDLNVREQMTVARRLIVHAVKVLSPYVPHIRLAAIPGNHGEERDANGKAFTDWTDNRDLAVFEQAFEVAQAGGYNVSLDLAQGLDMVIDVSGIGMAMAHGHQAKGSPEKWYTRQASRPDRPEMYGSKFLLCGHKHHLSILETDAGRSVISCPAMDGGSAWFSQTNGATSEAAMLLVSAGKAHGRAGWGDLRLIRSEI